jgi:signal transduction histidine kinase
MDTELPPTSPQSAATGDSPEEIARDISAVSRLQAVPTLLEVLCETTGMRFAAVARVTEHTWTACAVKDDIQFGLKPGGQLDLDSTLCIESKRANVPIVIEQASTDGRYRQHHTPKIYKIESYVSLPIVLPNGRYFGNLCAIDPAPAKVARQHSVSSKVRCDLGRVQQVASNLIGNALKHGAPQSPVKVSAHAEDSDFVLNVWHAGEPIPPENLDKICEPFWRPSTSGNREGLGLGLYICSQIVRAHGGTRSVTSTPESGTNFTARLPLNSDHLDDNTGNASSH